MSKLGEKLEDVHSNKRFLFFNSFACCVMCIFWILYMRDLLKYENILEIIIYIPVILLVINCINNFIVSKASLSFYENGFIYRGNIYLFEEIGHLRWYKTNYAFLNLIPIPLNYFYAIVGNSKINISDLYFKQVHKRYTKLYLETF